MDVEKYLDSIGAKSSAERLAAIAVLIWEIEAKLRLVYSKKDNGGVNLWTKDYHLQRPA